MVTLFSPYIGLCPIKLHKAKERAGIGTKTVSGYSSLLTDRILVLTFYPGVAWPNKPVKFVEIKLLAPSLNYQQRVYSNRNGLNSAELLTN